MNVGKPLKIKVEYENGSFMECKVEDLSEDGKKELAALGLIPWQMVTEGAKRYVLVEWKNGWKEIYSAPENVTAVRSYFVIGRLEETGRLFLEKKEGYPELIEILRKPQDVEKVTLL